MLDFSTRLLASRAYTINPYPALAHLRAHGPVARLHGLFPRPCWFVVTYDTAAQALTDPRLGKATPTWLADALPARGDGAPTLQNVDPPEHTRLRQALQPGFASSRIDALRPRIACLADEAVRRLRGRLMARVRFPSSALERRPRSATWAFIIV